MSANFTPNQNDYKNLTPFKSWLLLQINTWGQVNFPFVESDFDELTNYGMMQKLMGALNDVISNMNDVEEDMTNLFNAFTELQTYVNNYFENLDVQDEINAKLDSMAQDGTLTNLIKNYVDPIYQAFENDINNQISTLNDDVNTLDARMDEFTTLTDGSTTGDAELADVRVGFTGITSTNAGTSVRSQASDLNDIIFKEMNGFSRFNVSFVRGNVNNQGIFDNITYRVRSYNKLIFNEDIYVPYEIGDYRINIVIYENESATTGSTLLNYRGYNVIPANTYFMVVVRKKTENTSETADIYTMQKYACYISKNHNNILSLENGILENKSNIDKKLETNYYTTQEIQGTLTTGKYIDVRSDNEYTTANGQYLLIESGFEDGDTLLIDGFTATSYDYYPCAYFVDSNNIATILYGQSASDRGQHLNVEVVVPADTQKIYVNGSLNPSIIVTPSVKKKIYDTSFENIIYPLNIADALIRESKKNPFAFKTFDKGYISFVFDDARTDVDLVASIFAEYGFKLGLAIIPDYLDRTCNGLSETSQGYTTGMSVKDVCQRVVTLGGEVMSHYNQVVNVTNQYDKTFMYKYFVDTKQVLENNGFVVRGLIRTGGTGAISRTPEIERWLIGNYEYSNQGTAVNYAQDRVNITTTMSSLKSQIASAYNNHTWIKIMGHGIADETGGNNISESDLREILDYCVTLGIDVVTYADIFDEFSSSQFLNSIN